MKMSKRIGSFLICACCALIPAAATAQPDAGTNKADAGSAAAAPKTTLSPEDTKVREAGLLLRGKKYPQAEKILTEVLKKEPLHTLGLIYISELYLQTKRPDEAVAVLAKAIEDPKCPARVILQAAAVHTRRKESDKAKAFYDEAVKRHGDQADVYVRRAQHVGFRDMESSAADYTKALELDPKNRAALNNLAAIHIARYNYGDARKLLLRYREINKRSSSAAFNLASVYLALGEFENAEAIYNELQAANANDELSKSGLINAQILRGQPDKALEMLGDKATLPVKDGPERSPLFAYATGMAHLFKGDAKAASPHLEEATKKAGRRIFFSSAQVEALRQQGRFTEAKRILKTNARRGAKTLAYVKIYGALVELSAKNEQEARKMMAEGIALLKDYKKPEDLGTIMRLPPKAIADAKAILPTGDKPAEPKADAADPKPATKTDQDKGAAADTKPAKAKQGCGCTTPSAPASNTGWLVLLGLALFGAARRRAS